MAQLMNILMVNYALLFCTGLTCARNTYQDSTTIMDNLLKRINDLQVKKSTEFIPPFEYEKHKGVYGSEVKLNFHGPPPAKSIRDDIGVFDNNMFSTAWVTVCLVEASMYGVSSEPSVEQVEIALQAIGNHVDKNRAYNHSIMVFWPQVYNATVKTYQSTPRNLINMYGLMDEFQGGIEEALKLLGLKELEELFKSIMEMKSIFLDAFRIPPDFDDTFVNLGLGSLLKTFQASYPEAHEQWMSLNTNLTSVFDALKYYAYRPFSSESRINTIDSRTYFYLRHFLEKAKLDHADVSLVPTWIQDIDETRYMYARGDVMPFNINNVDVTVSANVIFGITSSVLSGLIPVSVLNDPDILQIYLNTSSMITYEIARNLTNRRDLALTYYPSLYEFYWFSARTLFILENRIETGSLPHMALTQVHTELSGVLRGNMTSAILKAARVEGQNVYFDDFLGDGDLTKDNKTVNHAEDRIFTTSMAVNALIQTWTVFHVDTKKLFWLPQTPVDVKDVIKQSVSWLEQNVLEKTYKPWNAFFSGSGKGFESMPFWFPVNRMEYLNGTKIHDDKNIPEYPFIMGFEGTVSRAEYNESCTKKHFGESTPIDFHGFNSGKGYFPFWSSDAYTYASTLLSISQYQNIHELHYRSYK